MKAIRVREYGEPEVMRQEDAAEVSAGPGEVVVEVKAVGVNPVDTYIRAGLYGSGSVPYTPGMDAAGIVAESGKGVRSVSVGERVYTVRTMSGAYAQRALCLEGQVHHLPDGVSFSQGAALGVPYGTAYRALFQRACAKRGEIVLVHGASGGVGIAAVQLAGSGGMKVVGTAGTEKGRKLLMEHGAQYAVDHNEPEHLNKVMAFSDGRGVDVVLEMLANVNLGRDLEVMAKGGRVVVIGSRGKVEIDPRQIMSREASILGVLMLNASASEMSSIYSAIGAGLEKGSLRPVVGLELPLAEAAKAHHEIIESSHYGKIVLIP